MKLENWDPDLRSVVSRIDEGEIDLQPDFQRGLAWNAAKQQRLVDTLLRGWSIPPIHLLELPQQRLAVLDGQQRLRAIAAFIHGEIRVGSFEPFDERVEQFRGKYFQQLPPDVKRKIQSYKLSCYRLYEYEPDEPYELFFRLNLPTGLTQAEKRNALVGDSRSQVKQLVELSHSAGWSIETIGFANSRMAYDDIVARACAYVEAKSLRVSLTAGELESQYRKNGGFGGDSVEVVSRAIVRSAALFDSDPEGPVLNKATLLTWLLVSCRQELDSGLGSLDLEEAFKAIERGRAAARRHDSRWSGGVLDGDAIARPYLDIYNDRASLRVNDVLSVVSRDACAWRLISLLIPAALDSARVRDLMRSLEVAEAEPAEIEQRALTVLDDATVWGDLR